MNDKNNVRGLGGASPIGCGFPRNEILKIDVQAIVIIS